MRKLFPIVCCIAAMIAVSGCSQEPQPVTTDEDEIAKYNAMINDPANLGEDPELEEE